MSSGTKDLALEQRVDALARLVDTAARLLGGSPSTVEQGCELAGRAWWLARPVSPGTARRLLLLARAAWTEEKSAAVAVAAALLLATAAGVVQARSLTVMRRRALDGPAQPALTASIRRGARTATLLRASIGALTIALVVIAATIT